MKNCTRRIILIIVAATLITGAIYISKNRQESKPEEIKEITQGYSYDQAQFDEFKSDIDSQTNESLVSFYLPESPSDQNVVFASTSSNPTGEWPDMKTTNKIYSYNIANQKLSLLYEEQEARTLRTMGIEDTKLIIMLDLIDNSPGPCFSIWSDWEDFAFLDIENPTALQAYSVPHYQEQKGIEEKEKCMEELQID